MYSACTIWIYVNTHSTTTTIASDRHVQYLPKFSCFTFVFVFLVRTFDMSYTLFTDFELHGPIVTTGTMLHRSLAFAHLESLKLDTHWKTSPHFPHLSDTDNHYFSSSVLQVNGKWKCSNTDKGTLLSLKQRNTATVTSESLEDKMLGADSQTRRTKMLRDFRGIREVSQIIRPIKADNTIVLIFNHFISLLDIYDWEEKDASVYHFSAILKEKVTGNFG